MSRIPLVNAENLTAEQRRIYEKVVSGPRGRVVGPLLAALHSPELADRWQSLGAHLRYETSLPERLKELAIIITGRHWNCAVEWTFHVELARSAGIPDNVIDAISRCEPPPFADTDQAIIYEYVRQALQSGDVADDIYDAVHQRFNPTGIVELTGLIGYYTLVAITLNSHDVPLPEGVVGPTFRDAKFARGEQPLAALPPAPQLAEA